jgi:hypothetical protein
MKIRIFWCLALLFSMGPLGSLGQDQGDGASMFPTGSPTDDDTSMSMPDQISISSVLNNQYAQMRQLLRTQLGIEVFTTVNRVQNVVQHFERNNTGALLVSKPNCNGGLVPKRIVVCGIVNGENDCQEIVFSKNADKNLMQTKRLLQKYAS